MKLKKLLSGIIASAMAVMTVTSVAVFEASAEDTVTPEDFRIAVYSMDEFGWNWINTDGAPLSSDSTGSAVGDAGFLNQYFEDGYGLRIGGIVYIDEVAAAAAIPNDQVLQATVTYEFLYGDTEIVIAEGSETMTFQPTGEGQSVLAETYYEPLSEDVVFNVRVSDQVLIDKPVYDEWSEKNGTYTFNANANNSPVGKFPINGDTKNIGAILFNLEWSEINGCGRYYLEGDDTAHGYYPDLTNGLNAIIVDEADYLGIEAWWLDSGKSIKVSNVKSVPASEDIPAEETVLADDEGFMQYGYDDNGVVYARYIQTVKLSDLEECSKATFEFTYGNTKKSGTSSTYYTALNYKGTTYTCNEGYVILSKTVKNAPGALSCKVTLS